MSRVDSRSGAHRSLGSERLAKRSVQRSTSAPFEVTASTMWRVVLATELLAALALRGAVFARPLAKLDRIFVPDDAYYTLAISRSLAHFRGPTADGHTLTSGFQPLIAFLVAPVFRLTSNLDYPLRADLFLLLMCDVLIVALLWVLGRRIAGPLAGAVGAGIWAISPAAVRLALGGLETTLAMVLELGLVACWLWTCDRPSSRRSTLLGVVAALAVLARVDALALVGLVVTVHLWRGPRRPLVTSAGAFVLVVGPWWAYCLMRFGTVVPSSGSAAHALQLGDPWSSLTTSAAGAALVNGPFAVWSALQGHLGAHRTIWPYWAALAVFGLTGTYFLGRIRRQDAREVDASSAAIGVLATFSALMIGFYGWFNVPYYVSRYLGPVVMVETLLVGCVLGVALRPLADAVHRRSRAIVAGRRFSPGTVAATCLSAALLVGGMVVLDRPLFVDSTASAKGAQYESATGYRPQAKLVDRLVPPRAVVGAAQSGALSYYAGDDRDVVNLDGVVDSAAASARKAKRIGAYLIERRVSWLADWSLTVASLAIEARNVDHRVRFAVVLRRRFNGKADFVVARLLPETD